MFFDFFIVAFLLKIYYDIFQDPTDKYRLFICTPQEVSQVRTWKLVVEYDRILFFGMAYFQGRSCC